MGMFSYLYDKNGHEYQFKHGDDDLNTYTEGGATKYSHVCPDGIYDAYDYSVKPKIDAFCVIKGNQCMEVVQEETELRTVAARQKQMDDLAAKWGVPTDKYDGWGKDLSGEPPEPEPTPEELQRRKDWAESPEGKAAIAATQKAWSEQLDKLVYSTTRRRGLLDFMIAQSRIAKPENLKID